MNKYLLETTYDKFIDMYRLRTKYYLPWRLNEESCYLYAAGTNYYSTKEERCNTYEANYTSHLMTDYFIIAGGTIDKSSAKLLYRMIRHLYYRNCD